MDEVADQNNATHSCEHNQQLPEADEALAGGGCWQPGLLCYLDWLWVGEDEVDVDEGVAEDEVDHGDDHEDCCSKSGKILFFILFLFCQVGDKVVVDNF